jgi:Uncharacterized conserved protein
MKRIAVILIGCFITSIGLAILSRAHIVAGGTAGLSLSLSYMLHLPFYALFFVTNLPFYIFSVLRMGWKFTLSTLFAVTVLSAMTAAIPLLPAITIPPWIGTLGGGTIIGLGLSLLFMNGASLGGANILALYLQKKWGWDPGKVNFAFDFVVILFALYSIGLWRGLYSVFTIAVISGIISIFKQRIANQGANSTPKFLRPRLRRNTL